VGVQAVKSGAYEVSVTHSGTHIAGSPFCAVVEPREVAPVACTAVGEVVAGELRCNQRASLIVKPADEFHNPITTPPLLGPEVSGQRIMLIIWVCAYMRRRQNCVWVDGCGCVLVFMCVRFRVLRERVYVFAWARARMCECVCCVYECMRVCA
jgi:hypothetical protein